MPGTVGPIDNSVHAHKLRSRDWLTGWITELAECSSPATTFKFTVCARFVPVQDLLQLIKFLHLLILIRCSPFNSNTGAHVGFSHFGNTNSRKLSPAQRRTDMCALGIMSASICVYTYMHIYIHICIHTYVPVSIYSFMYAPVSLCDCYLYVYQCLHAYV